MRFSQKYFPAGFIIFSPQHVGTIVLRSDPILPGQSALRQPQSPTATVLVTVAACPTTAATTSPRPAPSPSSRSAPAPIPAADQRRPRQRAPPPGDGRERPSLSALGVSSLVLLVAPAPLLPRHSSHSPLRPGAALFPCLQIFDGFVPPPAQFDLGQPAQPPHRSTRRPTPFLLAATDLARVPPPIAAAASTSLQYSHRNAWRAITGRGAASTTATG